jgi:hypothetical protein
MAILSGFKDNLQPFKNIIIPRLLQLEFDAVWLTGKRIRPRAPANIMLCDFRCQVVFNSKHVSQDASPIPKRDDAQARRRFVVRMRSRLHARLFLEVWDQRVGALL